MTDANANWRRAVGPLELYAYHDHRTRPWSSPFYAGFKVAGVHIYEVHLSPDSRLRPFSGGERR